MIRLDIKSVRYDRMNDGVQFDTAAVLKAVEIQTFIQQAANRIPADDGKIRLTKATLNGRDWE